MTKSKRQAVIRDIIEETAVGTQGQLLAALKARGIDVTQATISRDIKELHLVKESTGRGGYRYAVSEQALAQREAGRLHSIFRDGAVSFEPAGNLVVAKTMPGLAPAAGAALDGMEIAELIGTLAGDDTVLLVFRTAEGARRFCESDHRTLG